MNAAAPAAGVTVAALTVDCADPASLADFWGRSSPDGPLDHVHRPGGQRVRPADLVGCQVRVAGEVAHDAGTAAHLQSKPDSAKSPYVRFSD
jgi:hypothetical protein